MKALASDMDGTLVFKGEIKDIDLKAIKKFQKNGNLFGVCTGRALEMCTRDISKFQCDFVICSSGAQIIDHNLNTIYELTIQYADIEEIFNDYQKYTTEVIIQANNTGYMYNQSYYAMKAFYDIHEFKDAKIYGISLVFDGMEETMRVAEDLKVRYPHLAGHVNGPSIDIVDASCSKGVAIKRLKEELGIDIIGGIGDSYNDETMLEAADISFSFPSSPESTRAKATHIVENVAEALEIM